MAFFSALFLLFQVGSLAKAKILDEDGRAISSSRFAIFSKEDCPEEVETALEQLGFGEYACYQGALYQFPEVDENAEEQPVDGQYTVSALALIALEKEDERILVFMRQGQYGLWTAENLGAKALLTGREFTIGLTNVPRAADVSWEKDVSQLLDVSSKQRGMQFVTQYPTPEGGMESYGFWDDGGIAVIRGYERVDSEGKGIAILSDCGYRVVELPEANLYGLFGKGTYSSVYVPFAPMWPSSMQDIAEDPDKWDAARETLAQESLASFEGKDIAVIDYSYSAALYETPVEGSQFSCWLSKGMPAEILGQEIQIESWSETSWEVVWNHVRVDRERGWTTRVSESLNETNMGTALWKYPVLVARATGSLSLRESPNAGSSILKEIPQGAMMHVLTMRNDGWFHVMVPRSEISWLVDMEGQSGYVRREGVIVSGDEFYPAYAPIWPSYMENIADYAHQA